MTKGGTYRRGHFGKTPEGSQTFRELQTGRTYSKESREKMSRSKRGENNPMYGVIGEDNPSFGVSRPKREDAPNWKGGRIIDSSGYILILDPEKSRTGRYIPEHVLIAQEALGRPLRFISPGHGDNETVHHINFNRADNRPENLLICTHSYHMALHNRIRGLGLEDHFRSLEAA